MFTTITPTQKGIFLALLGFNIYVIADAGAKWLSASYPILHVVAWTYFFALVFSVLCAPWLGGFRRTFQTKRLKLHILRAFCNLGLSTCAVKAFALLPLTSAYTIFFLAPFLITILAIPVFREQVAPKNWAVIALGFSGVLVAFPPDHEALFSPAILYALAGAFLVAVMALLARPLDKEETVLSLAFYPSLICSVVLLPLSFYDGVFPHPAHIPVFAVSGLAVTLALACVARAYRMARFAVVAPLHYSQIVWGVAIGYAVFGDLPGWRMILGAAIIIGSGIYLIETERRTMRHVEF